MIRPPDLNAGSLNQFSIRQMYLDLLKACLCGSHFEESSWKPTEIPNLTLTELFRNPTASLKNWCLGQLMKWTVDGPLIVYTRLPYDREAREEGRDWPNLAFTMIGFRRIENIQFCVDDVICRKVPGDLIETGVWRGGAAIFMRALLKVHNVTDRSVWLADSFEGLPKPLDEADGWDLSDCQYLKVSLDQVMKNFEQFGLLDDQVKFIKGWFHQTLPVAPVNQIAVLRMDGDLYSSTIDTLRYLYDKISPGGYCIVDDYFSWPSCHRAVHDFLKEKNIFPEIRRIDTEGAFWQVT